MTIDGSVSWNSSARRSMTVPSPLSFDAPHLDRLREGPYLADERVLPTDLLLPPQEGPHFGRPASHLPPHAGPWRLAPPGRDLLIHGVIHLGVRFAPSRSTRSLSGPVAHIRRQPQVHHTAATLAIESGIHPKFVQEMLAHASIKTTLNVYSHVSEELSRAAAERLDAFLADAEAARDATTSGG